MDKKEVEKILKNLKRFVEHFGLKEKEGENVNLKELLECLCSGDKIDKNKSIKVSRKSPDKQLYHSDPELVRSLWSKIDCLGLEEDHVGLLEGFLSENCNNESIKEAIERFDEEDLVLGLSSVDSERLEVRKRRQKLLEECGWVMDLEEEDE